MKDFVYLKFLEAATVYDDLRHLTSHTHTYICTNYLITNYILYTKYKTKANSLYAWNCTVLGHKVFSSSDSGLQANYNGLKEDWLCLFGSLFLHLFRPLTSPQATPLICHRMLSQHEIESWGDRCVRTCCQLNTICLLSRHIFTKFSPGVLVIEEAWDIFVIAVSAQI